MKFSTRAGYGLRAVVNLARIYPRQNSIHQISREEGISFKYLEQLFRILKKNRIIRSAKGRKGGYRLSNSPGSFKVGKIIEALEGPVVSMECASGKCNSNCDCSSGIVWIKLQKQIRKTLYSIKLSDLIK
jgi:Rrf2 family protein